MRIDEIIELLDEIRQEDHSFQDELLMLEKLEQIRPLIKSELDLKKIELADKQIEIFDFMEEEYKKSWSWLTDKFKEVSLLIQRDNLIDKIKQLEGL